MKAARRILFVDDDELILRSMERVLRRPAAESGWELCFATSGEAALEEMARSPVEVMLVDSNISAPEAVSASWRAAHSNKGEMIRWGIIVGALLVLGSIPLFVGLAFVLPWLGYATWHLYTRLIDRDALGSRQVA